jgi:hypothetical protein
MGTHYRPCADRNPQAAEKQPMELKTAHVVQGVFLRPRDTGKLIDSKWTNQIRLGQPSRFGPWFNLDGKADAETGSDYGGFRLEQKVRYSPDSTAALWHPLIKSAYRPARYGPKHPRTGNQTATNRQLPSRLTRRRVGSSFLTDAIAPRRLRRQVLDRDAFERAARSLAIERDLLFLGRGLPHLDRHVASRTGAEEPQLHGGTRRKHADLEAQLIGVVNRLPVHRKDNVALFQIAVGGPAVSRDVTGGNQEIGFAVPVKLAHQVADQILKNGKVERAYRGVVPQDVTPAMAKAFGAKEAKGALVGDGPAVRNPRGNPRRCVVGATQLDAYWKHDNSRFFRLSRCCTGDTPRLTTAIGVISQGGVTLDHRLAVIVADLLESATIALQRGLFGGVAGDSETRSSATVTPHEYVDDTVTILAAAPSSCF